MPNDCMGRDSSVGIATRYGLERSGEDKILRTRPGFPWGPPCYKSRTGSLPGGGGGKAAEAWRRPPTTSSAEVKERV